MYTFGVAGQSFLAQLPLLRREECLISGHGKVTHEDIDWDAFYARSHG